MRAKEETYLQHRQWNPLLVLLRGHAHSGFGASIAHSQATASRRAGTSSGSIVESIDLLRVLCVPVHTDDDGPFVFHGVRPGSASRAERYPTQDPIPYE